MFEIITATALSLSFALSAGVVTRVIVTRNHTA